jgi:hypothetical protein
LSNASISNPIATITNTTGSDIQQMYVLTTVRGSGCVTRDTVVITVRSQPVGIATPVNATICSGQTAVANIAAVPAGSSFTWTATPSSASITGAAPGTGAIISQTLFNSSTTQGSVKYIITPTSSLGCLGDTFSTTIFVQPVAVGTATPATTTICNGQATNIALASTTPGATFSWTASGLNSTAGSGSTIAQTLNNGTGAAVTVTYTITPSIGGCPGTPFTANVTVNPTPTPTITSSNADMCANASPRALAATPSGGTFSGSGVVGSTFDPAVAGVGTHTITYSFTNPNGCTDSAFQNILVNPLPSVDAGNSTTVCPGTSTFIGGTPTAGGTSPLTTGKTALSQDLIAFNSLISVIFC